MVNDGIAALRRGVSERSRANLTVQVVAQWIAGIFIALGVGVAGCRSSAIKEGAVLGDADTGVHAASPTQQGARTWNARVHVVDVGTGLATFVEGEDFTLLFDGGSNDDLRDEHHNRLVSYLQALRPNLVTLDHIVVSHGHRDHVELLADVIDRYNVASVWEPGVLVKPCAYQRFVHAVARRKTIRYHTAVQGPGPASLTFPETSCKLPRDVSLNFDSRIEEGATVALGRGTSMTFLHVDGQRRANLNENSLVVLLVLHGTRVLFMGDAEAGKRESPEAPPLETSIEGRLLRSHAAQLKSDVLVVGHHGSKTSTRERFLNAVAPTIAIISSGPHAYEGHVLPDEEVVAALSKRSQLFRTDLSDSTCARSATKIGRREDGRPGGCSNVIVEIKDGASARAKYYPAE